MKPYQNNSRAAYENISKNNKNYRENIVWYETPVAIYKTNCYSINCMLAYKV